LMPIQGYSEMLIRQLEPETTSRTYAEQILKASKRARDLVQQILAISRQKEQETIVFSLESVVNEVVKLLRATLPATITLCITRNTCEDRVMADPTQMHQVLMNLCTNAAYAMKEQNGVLEITLEAQDGFIQGWSTSGQRKLQGHICLSVRDEGKGIDPRHLERIFDPFFTTKPVGEGTGLGLAVVHGIVGSLGGHISVESEPGQGTIFRLYLPVTKNTGVGSVANEPETPRGAGQHLLLVDDETEILDLLGAFLRGIGYTVEGCSNGLAALELMAESSMPFDLVLTHLTMPGLSGLELAQELLERDPSLPVLLLTGHRNGPGPMPDNICRVLGKPVNLVDLASQIAQYLEPSRKGSGPET